MGMEPINRISSIQAQATMRPVVAPKVSNEVAEGTASNVTVPKIDNTTIAVAKSQDNGANKGYEGQEGTTASQESIRKAVENINKNLHDSEAIFGIHEKTNRVTIKIVDKKTKEVIKELPAEKTLDMIAKAWELAGLMVDEKR